MTTASHNVILNNDNGWGIAMSELQSRYLSDLLRGNNDALVLFLVKELDNAYGYQLIKEIKSRSDGFFTFKEGTVYPTLHRLENEGLLKGKWEEMPNGQERRYYSITEKGNETLEKKLAVWESFSNAMNLIINPDKV